MTTGGNIAQRLREMRESKRPVLLERTRTLQAAAEAERNGGLTAELRNDALDEAHRLKGLLGTLGFPEGSEAAAQFERILRDGTGTEELGPLVEIIRQV
jgi:HPt (histidine-containing phosphotransfer) domain-containing protein